MNTLPDRPLRILHCPSNVGNNPQRIVNAERELGLESSAVTLRQRYFNYPVDEVLFRSGEFPLLGELRRWRLLWRAMHYYDIVHFNFGRTLLPNYIPQDRPNPQYPEILYRLHNLYARPLHMRDLVLLRRMGKGILVTFQGDDIRQGDFCRANFAVSHVSEVPDRYYSPKGDAQKRKNIATFARCADRLYSLNMDLMRVLPPQAEFLPYAGVDLRAPEWQPVYPDPNRHRLKVLHAPTQRAVKGTRFILEAVDRLQAEGLDFEFVLVEGLAHDEAQQLYREADLLIDQLLIGGYGGLGVELMALGKPVICYYREDDLRFLPPQMRADWPLINASPDTLYDVLKSWLSERRGELPARGECSRRFVEAWHDPLKIAARLKEAYESILLARQTSR